MPQLTLTAGAHPAFLSKNYVNRDSHKAGDLVVSTGDSVKNRLYQMDFTAQWTSAGSSDATTETITIGLYQGSSQISRTIDFLALYNINLKNFVLEYSNDNGITWTTVTGFNYAQGTADYADDDLVVALAASITANKLRLTMTRTQTANAEKLVGGIVAALATMQSTNAMSKYEPNREENRRDVRMADGSISYGVQYRADNSFEFYDCKVGWRFVTAAELATFVSVKNTVEPVLWYPEPGDVVRGIYLARIRPKSFKYPYSSTYKGAGFDVDFDVEEVGGA